MACNLAYNMNKLLHAIDIATLAALPDGLLDSFHDARIVRPQSEHGVSMDVDDAHIPPVPKLSALQLHKQKYQTWQQKWVAACKYLLSAKRTIVTAEGEVVPSPHTKALAQYAEA
jgi:hypothetical protein